jgi:hypothetical protein
LESARVTDVEDPADALLRQAEAGGPGAALAARRAAWLSEAYNPDMAKRALALAARLDPLDPTPRLALARLHAEAGELDAAKAQAQAVFEQAVDQAARARATFLLGEVFRATGELGPARQSYQAAADIEDALLKADRSNPHAARWYARALGRLAELDAGEGALARARNGARTALALIQAVAAQMSETPALAADIADGEMRLAALELDAGDAPSARRRLGQAIGRYEALILIEPKEPHWRAVLSEAWALAAEADYMRGAAAQARDAMDRALALRVKLAAEDPGERWALAGAWRLRAALLAGLGDAKGAADSLTQARALGERLCAETEHANAPARFLFHTMLDQTDHHLRSGQIDAASEAANAARERAESFAKAASCDPRWKGDLAAAWDRLGEIAHAAGAAHVDAFARAVEFRRMAFEAAPDDAKSGKTLTAALIKYGDAALAERNFNAARHAFEESVALRLRLAEAAPGDAAAAHALAVALERVGVAAAADGDRASARSAWESELELADRVFDESSGAEAQRFRAIVEAHLANLGGIDASQWRDAALARLDALARLGVLTERDVALRKKLWSA